MHFPPFGVSVSFWGFWGCALLFTGGIFRCSIRLVSSEPHLPRACYFSFFEKVLAEALLPSARYERRAGVSLVRAAWERRPEGPAYLLSSVTLLYLAGLCAF